MRIIWILLCWLIRISAGCVLYDNTSITVTKNSGEDVLLPCSCAQLQTKPWNMRWLKNPGRSHTEIHPHTHKNFKGRIQICNKDSPGNFSLVISRLTKNDEGIYRCDNSGPYRDITLQVTELDPVSPTMTSPTTAPEKPKPNTESEEKDSQTKQPPPYIFILVAVLLVLLLGGAAFLYGRHKGVKGKSSQMHDKDQKKDSRIDFTTQDTRKDTQAESKDDVTYTTVVHGRNPKVAQVRVDTDDRTEYASIRTT